MCALAQVYSNRVRGEVVVEVLGEARAIFVDEEEELLQVLDGLLWRGLVIREVGLIDLLIRGIELVRLHKEHRVGLLSGLLPQIYALGTVSEVLLLAALAQRILLLRTVLAHIDCHTFVVCSLGANSCRICILRAIREHLLVQDLVSAEEVLVSTLRGELVDQQVLVIALVALQ